MCKATSSSHKHVVATTQLNIKTSEVCLRQETSLVVMFNYDVATTCLMKLQQHAVAAAVTIADNQQLLVRLWTACPG